MVTQTDEEQQVDPAQPSPAAPPAPAPRSPLYKPPVPTLGDLVRRKKQGVASGGAGVEEVTDEAVRSLTKGVQMQQLVQTLKEMRSQGKPESEMTAVLLEVMRNNQELTNTLLTSLLTGGDDSTKDILKTLLDHTLNEKEKDGGEGSTMGQVLTALLDHTLKQGDKPQAQAPTVGAQALEWAQTFNAIRGERPDPLSQLTALLGFIDRVRPPQAPAAPSTPIMVNAPGGSVPFEYYKWNAEFGYQVKKEERESEQRGKMFEGMRSTVGDLAGAVRDAISEMRVRDASGGGPQAETDAPPVVGSTRQAMARSACDFCHVEVAIPQTARKFRCPDCGKVSAVEEEPVAARRIGPPAQEKTAQPNTDGNAAVGG